MRPARPRVPHSKEQILHGEHGLEPDKEGKNRSNKKRHEFLNREKKNMGVSQPPASPVFQRERRAEWGREQ